MIEFKPIRIEDRAAIERYTMAAGIANCDLAFANMFCWQGVYRSGWAEVDGFLVIRFHIDGGPRIGYMQPVGKGDFTPLLPLLEADARSHGEPLRLVGLTEEGCALLRREGGFALVEEPDAEDYVYAAADLRELPGRRYQPKRNHLNRFTAACPDHRYEPLTPQRFEECMALEREWRRAHEGHASELCAEQRAIRLAFDHFDELGLLGGCLYAGDRLVAFTYGSALTKEVFDTHIEKADTSCEGAFTAINKLFAQHLPDRFRYIDREEDLGIEGLRRAKRSYHPAFQQRKFAALRLTAEQQGCKRLWQEVFGDEEAFIDTYLLRYDAPGQALVLQEQERVVAMLHLLPMHSELGRTIYVYGVATAPTHRGRGLASRLMEEAVRRIDASGADAAMLIPTPGEEWLLSFYGRYGFEGAVPAAFVSPDGFDFGTGDPAADRAMVRRRDSDAPLPGQIVCTVTGQ